MRPVTPLGEGGDIRKCRRERSGPDREITCDAAEDWGECVPLDEKLDAHRRWLSERIVEDRRVRADVPHRREVDEPLECVSSQRLSLQGDGHVKTVVKVRGPRCFE